MANFPESPRPEHEKSADTVSDLIESCEHRFAEQSHADHGELLMQVDESIPGQPRMVRSIVMETVEPHSGASSYFAIEKIVGDGRDTVHRVRTILNNTDRVTRVSYRDDCVHIDPSKGIDNLTVECNMSFYNISGALTGKTVTVAVSDLVRIIGDARLVSAPHARKLLKADQRNRGKLYRL